MRTFYTLVAGSLMLCVIALGVRSVAAYDANGRFRAFGPANEPCSEFNSLRDRALPGRTMEEHEAIETAVDYWISGWVTAWNYLSTETYDITGGYRFEDLVEQVEKFCERHPDKKLINAVNIVGHALYPWRLKKQPMAKPK